MMSLPSASGALFSSFIVSLHTMQLKRPISGLRRSMISSALARDHFPFVFSQAFLGTRLARYSGSVAYRSAFSLPGKCLTERPFRLTVHQPLGGPRGPDSVGTTS